MSRAKYVFRAKPFKIPKRKKPYSQVEALFRPPAYERRRGCLLPRCPSIHSKISGGQQKGKRSILMMFSFTGIDHRSYAEELRTRDANGHDFTRDDRRAISRVSPYIIFGSDDEILDRVYRTCEAAQLSKRIGGHHLCAYRTAANLLDALLDRGHRNPRGESGPSTACFWFLKEPRWNNAQVIPKKPCAFPHVLYSERSRCFQ